MFAAAHRERFCAIIQANIGAGVQRWHGVHTEHDLSNPGTEVGYTCQLEEGRGRGGEGRGGEGRGGEGRGGEGRREIE